MYTNIFGMYSHGPILLFHGNEPVSIDALVNEPD